LNLDVGKISGSYYIDDPAVQEIASATASTNHSPSKADTTAIDQAMHTWISGMVGHYKEKITARDVVNEAISDGTTPTIRTSSETTTGGNFYWACFLGRNYAVKAFKYAAEADPSALLFINDYNLELNPAKLDTLIAYVNEIRRPGAKADGIGTQIHIAINVNLTNVDNMFQKLAATGLKIRIRELDVCVNPSKVSDFKANEDVFSKQAAIYKYVIAFYI
jgi:endo-1,4-beta-xylanase